MKIILSTVVSSVLSLILATGAEASPAAESFSLAHVYQCGERKVSVETSASSFKILVSYHSSLKHVVNIESASQSAVELTAEFAGRGLFVTSSDTAPTGLAQGSLAFSGFHYSSGAMFVISEGDTNEEGYTFAAEEGLLLGKQQVAASDVFWSDRHESQISNFNCVLLN